MFTKKHFEKAAQHVNMITSVPVALRTMKTLIEMFEKDNPRFDKDKFREACGFWFLKDEYEEENYEAHAKF